MAVTASRFECGGCGKSYTWKQELAGRRVKCKCGHVMTVPQSPPGAEPEPPADDLYDLAPDPQEGKPKKPRVPLAPVVPKSEERATRAPLVAPTVAAAGPAPAGAGAGGIPLAYQKGPTQRERERMGSDVLMDMRRDVYVPVALLVVGFLMYVGYYAVRYEMSGAGIALVSLGVGMITLFKAALLIGFAFVVAGPLGVSFGGIFTAALKLAAIAVFADGVATWIDAGTAKMTGGAGGAFSGMLSFPVVLGVYWVLLIYLFSMDAGDSWIVVILLALFDFIVRWLLLLLLLSTILNWGGVSGVAVPTLGGGGGAKVSSNPMSVQVNELKEQGLLREGREFIAGGRQMAFGKPVEAWYAAGCKNVWFSVVADFDGKPTPASVIVELPKDKAKRQQCYDILKAYYDEHNFSYDSEDVTDSGDPYIFVGVR